jgi:N-acetylmuramoyl-L-alanine amidase
MQGTGSSSGRQRAAVVVVAAALVLTGCGGDDDDAVAAPVSPTQTALPTTPATPTPTPTPTAPADEVYVVESGDTLSSIAQRFGVTVAAIVEANDLTDPDRLAIGDELVIPGGAAPEVPATEVPAEDATEG